MAMNFHFFPCPICHMELFWELRGITVCVCVCMYIWFVVVPSVMSNSLWLHGLQNSQDFLSFTICQNLFTLMSIELAMPSNHPILCCCLLALSLSQRQGISQWAGFSRQVVKLLMELGISSCSGLISFRIDWLTLFTVQGTLKSLLQHSLKASILRHSAFLMVQLSHIYGT